MKKYLFFVIATLFVFSPLAANAGCDEVVESIQQKIVNNGVSSESFTLTVVDVEQTEQAKAKDADKSKVEVVGNCENESKNIIYTRH